MLGGLTAGAIVFLAVIAIAIIFIGWIVTSVALTGILSWNLPGLLISPPVHIVNTLIASAMTLAVIVATFVILLRGYNVNIIPF